MTDIPVKREEQQPVEVTTAEPTRGGHAFSPRFDIWEAEDALVLYGDLPGVTAEDLDIRFENHELTIHGKVKPRHEGIHFLHGEYAVGDYYRTFAVGEDVDVENISAELRNGVLTLRLPKSESAKPRRIQVQAND